MEDDADQDPNPLPRQRLADQQWVFQAHKGKMGSEWNGTYLSFSSCIRQKMASST